MGTTSAAIAAGSLHRRALRLLLRPVGRLTSWRRIRRASAALRSSVAPSPPPTPVSEAVSVVCSYRLANEERLGILATTIDRLAEGLAGTDVAVHVADASDAAMAARAATLWASSGMAATVHEDPAPLAVALRQILDSLEQPYFCLQFDDMLTTGLDANYLAAACDLLAMHPQVGAVCPFWPLDVEVDPQGVTLTSYEVAGAGQDATYRFRGTKPLTPVAVETHRGRRFGIFENFTYGFFLNDLVAPAADYRRRLGWYLDSLGTTSAHAVELAAAPKLRGPWWTHLAVCLDGVTLLDLDYAHTDAAVRAEVPANRAVFDAVAAGAPVRVVPRVKA